MRRQNLEAVCMGLSEYSSVDQVQVAIGEVGVAVGHMEALILTFLDMAFEMPN